MANLERPKSTRETTPTAGAATSKRKRGTADGSSSLPAIEFPIVALGASAGGIEALRQLFAQLPADTGMGFIVIQHLDPTRPSMLASVLGRNISLPVVEATDGTPVLPNHIYVIPPDADIAIRGGSLALVPRQHERGLHLPIDSFFRALAEDRPGRVIGVVLSGSGSDGTDGLRAIKAAGGITFAQDPESAQFRSMPESAIAAGVVDTSLSPEGIAGELARLSAHPYLFDESDPAPADEQQLLSRALASVHRHAHTDFTGYKRPTVMRRIARRMALRKSDSLSEYTAALQDDPIEAKALARDILIHVTAFFRDRDAFDTLERTVLPELLKHKEANDAIRVWVPGCSTGEEAYSLAIGLCELLDAHDSEVPMKIFGTDLSAEAIEVARAGQFPEAALAGVSPERRARFFEPIHGGFRIRKQVRNRCVFVKHDLTRDPPFARLDLISCRNILIYFGAELQRRIFPMLHHCLNKPGYLFLGRSETVGGFRDLFVPCDREHRIFLKTGESGWLAYPPAFGHEAEARLPANIPAERLRPAREAERQADHNLLTRYAPPGAVINDRWEVVQFRGRTRDFLEAPPGQPQRSILRMVREGLLSPLRELLEAAPGTSVPLRKEGVRLSSAGHTRVVNLEVVPLVSVHETQERHYLVIFEEVTERGAEAPAPAAYPPAAPAERSDEVARLEAELIATRDYLQAVIGEHQDTTDELAGANEELIAGNEELQSTNEELESAKEELQATNEEVTTVNDELRNRNRELDLVANDLANVLESVEIPVIIVDHKLRIRRFTPVTQLISSLIPGDIGRSIDEVKLKVRVDDLSVRIRSSIEAVTLKEWEVQGLEGQWYRLQIRPYRTADNSLDGAILSFVDVDILKRTAQEAESARDYARGLVETVPVPLVVLDADLRVASVNRAFCDNFAVSASAVEGVGLFDLADGAWHVPALREAVERTLTARTRFRDLEVQCKLPGRGQRELSIAGCPVQADHGGSMILLAIEDVTERHLLEASEKQSRIEAEQANRAKDLFLATLSHELRTPLSTIVTSAQVLASLTPHDPRSERATGALLRAVRNQVRLIDDLLDISRIVSGKLMLDLETVDPATIVEGAADAARASAEAKGVGLEVVCRGEVGSIHGDCARLQQVVANLIHNSIKFTPKGGTVTVTLEQADERAHITVADTGVGIRSELLPHLFDRFVQAESAMTRTHGGLGLGLAIVRHLVDVHGGDVHAESAGEGQGATFRVTLPIAARHVAPTRPAAPRTVARSFEGIRVLLIEDDDDTRDAFATTLTDLRADVRAVASAAEGLAAVADFAPHVILCDIAMPAEDGYAFIRKLRETSKARGGQTPAAALTALAGEEDRQRALRAGFQMHLTKPIDAARLAAAVGALSSWAQHGDSPEASAS